MSQIHVPSEGNDHGESEYLEKGTITADQRAAMSSGLVTRRSVIRRTAGVSAALAGSAYILSSTAAAASSNVLAATPEASPATLASPVAASSPTIVLVHGAWADGSSWAQVIPALVASGQTVIAPANPLRSLSGDAAYIASVINNIQGPVLLVGHSYGGAVITNAASQVKNVLGLVYVAGFLPDEGETLQGLATAATDSLLGPALRPAPYVPGAGSKPGTEFFIDPASFHAVFCADLPTDQSELMAITQRPIADLAFGEPTQNPAWKTLPSWAAVGTADMAIGASGSRLMAQRAGATTVEVDGSHVLMLSHPDAVIDLIQSALGSLS